MARETFRGAIPGDRLYDAHHDMWVVRSGASVIVDATSFGLFLAGSIVAFTAKPRGAEVERGRGLGTVESAKTVLAVHSPLSLVLEEANEQAEQHPKVINDDPYCAGWMVRGTPLEWQVESAALVDAAAYAAHVRALEPDAVIEP